MSGVQGQFSSSINASLQQGLFQQFGGAGQSAGQAFGQQGIYNNMSITVSMAPRGSGVGCLPAMGQPVGLSNSNLSNVGSVCSDQQVNVQCTVNLLGSDSSYLNPGPIGAPAPQKGPQGPQGSQNPAANQKSLLQQLLTEFRDLGEWSLGFMEKHCLVVCRIASAIPHRAGNTKKTGFWSG
ncbi:hypothetical protein F7725_019907 [Dissostichus mawsoni]|uniref:Uncharacterized protein n=1 Tax=Dissostichus mawsoni TaxID=36200 RepID=A0A7J5YPI9_DISMA|nr:hypothetical protein F7725_019907 [Dissostichus mawsoni]